MNESPWSRLAGSSSARERERGFLDCCLESGSLTSLSLVLDVCDLPCLSASSASLVACSKQETLILDLLALGFVASFFDTVTDSMFLREVWLLACGFTLDAAAVKGVVMRLAEVCDLVILTGFSTEHSIVFGATILPLVSLTVKFSCFRLF